MRENGWPEGSRLASCLTVLSVLLLFLFFVFSTLPARAADPSNEPEDPTKVKVITPTQQIGGAPGEAEPGTESDQSWLHLTDGVAAGEVTPAGAVIWARASGPALVHVTVDTNPDASRPALRPAPVPALAEHDFTAKVPVDSLAAGTKYFYTVWLTSAPGEGEIRSKPERGSFRTPPDSTSTAPVTLVWGGGLGGDGYCRRPDKGYPIFSRMGEVSPDVFLATGDMIDADGTCPEGGPGTWTNRPADFSSVEDDAVPWTDSGLMHQIYWQHWQYNREDGHFRRFLSTVPMLAQWSDRDVLEGFGASWPNAPGRFSSREGYGSLVSAGRDAFFDYAPMLRPDDDPNRIYRSYRYGRDLELFLLDTRSYRSQNRLADTPANAKTMLGPAQLAWLQRGLSRSNATWKIISVDASIAAPMPTPGPGMDAWVNGADSTGFERDLTALLAGLERAGVRNMVFLTSGLGWPAEIRYETDPAGTGKRLVFHEFAAGPLSARCGDPADLDPTFLPRQLYAEGGIRNFGQVTVGPEKDGKVHLVARIFGEDGKVRSGSTLDLAPEDGTAASGSGSGPTRTRS